MLEDEYQKSLLEDRDEILFPNKISYKGQWRGKKKNGYGIQVWPDGSRYEGQWKNDKAHGKGKFYFVCGDTYDGEWAEDKV